MNPLLILREEIVCLVILLFLLVNALAYQTGRDSGSFLRLALCAVGHVACEILVVLAMNPPGRVGAGANRLFHAFFYLFAVLFAYEFFCCTVRLGFASRAAVRRARRWGLPAVLLYAAALPFLPLYYLKGNGIHYGMGPFIVVSFAVAMLYFAASAVILFLRRRRIPRQVKLALLPLLLAMMATEGLQWAVPELFFSGGALTVVTVGFFFALENPADFYYGVLWNKFFRREIIEQYHLRMDSSISWCEDFMFNLEYIRHASSFYALGVPIYYYVKTKGSLASQGLSLTKTINMKKMVFAYYHNFYKSILTEEDYEKNRLQVYKFLLDAASDGMASLVLPGTKKLGDERTSACSIDVEGDGILMDEYRDRKLLDRYLEPIALKNDLQLQDIRLVMYLSQPHRISSRKELMDYTNMTKNTLSASLQRLISKGIMKIEELKVPIQTEIQAAQQDSAKKTSRRGKTVRKLEITLLPAADSILKSLSVAENDYEQARYADLTDEEIVQYAYLNSKIKQSIQKIL